MPMNKGGKKVFVGLSGGVDSSVSLYLLKESGYDVTAVFIKVWQPDFVNCTWQEDRLYAMRAAAHLSVPFLTLDLEKEYKQGVVDYMLSEYQSGRTPNPDVMCNKEVKFGAFFKWAKENGADFIATGHYAQNIYNEKTKLFELHRGIDDSKDQSYFLWTLTQEVLSHALFPIGGMKKSAVRKIAQNIQLPNALKKDSQGLCFISNVDMKDFLAHFIKHERGKVLDEEGQEIGQHNGAIFVTIGERHSFSVASKTPSEKPYYVVRKDVGKNTIVVSHTPPQEKENSPLLLKDTNFIEGLIPPPGIYTAETRYHGERIEVELIETSNGIKISPHKALFKAPGQSLVLYKNTKCLGGGVIV